jgi:LysM repeat protein
MNNPNPLVPQGSLPNASRGKSSVRIAIFTIVAIHSVFFAGLLMQGCRRDDTTKSPTDKSSDLGTLSDLAKLDTNYYQPLPETPLPANVPPATNTDTTSGYAATPPPLTSAVTTPPVTETPPAPVETKEYTIVRNDTLVKIAKANHVTVGDITRANPGLNPRKLIPGKKIQVPLASRGAGAGGEGLGFAEPAANGGKLIHQVKAGETLTKIAKQHGVTIKELRAANGLRTDRLLIGQKLKLPPSAAPAGAGIETADPTLVPGGPTTLSATNPAGNTTVR